VRACQVRQPLALQAPQRDDSILIDQRGAQAIRSGDDGRDELTRIEQRFPLAAAGIDDMYLAIVFRPENRPGRRSRDGRNPLFAGGAASFVADAPQRAAITL
jgi:hypothetical protein